MTYRMIPIPRMRHLQVVLVTTGLAVCLLGGAARHGTAASLMSCMVIKWSDSAYWYKEGIWAGRDPISGETMPKGTYFHESLPTSANSPVPIGYLFSKLDEPLVVVKQLYADGSSGVELTGRVLQRQDGAVWIQWPLRSPVGIRVALINTEAKRAVISITETGIAALAVSAAVLDCK
jgi:hypothetical protein